MKCVLFFGLCLVLATVVAGKREDRAELDDRRDDDAVRKYSYKGRGSLAVSYNPGYSPRAAYQQYGSRLYDLGSLSFRYYAPYYYYYGSPYNYDYRPYGGYSGYSGYSGYGGYNNGASDSAYGDDKHYYPYYSRHSDKNYGYGYKSPSYSAQKYPYYKTDGKYGGYGYGSYGYDSSYYPSSYGYGHQGYGGQGYGYQGGYLREQDRQDDDDEVDERQQ